MGTRVPDCLLQKKIGCDQGTAFLQVRAASDPVIT